ncbi:uncharacterized protein LOC118277520 isoform X2 [Spodoptera frugiperda]|nr:uncharacterized protein LOC118277520 isoform X2 [Spodoptera frugiperda]
MFVMNIIIFRVPVIIVEFQLDLHPPYHLLLPRLFRHLPFRALLPRLYRRLPYQALLPRLYRRPQYQVLLPRQHRHPQALLVTIMLDNKTILAMEEIPTEMVKLEMVATSITLILE